MTDDIKKRMAEFMEYTPSGPLLTDSRGVIKPQKTEACAACCGMGSYTDFGYDEFVERKCEACHGLGYQGEQND